MMNPGGAAAKTQVGLLGHRYMWRAVGDFAPGPGAAGLRGQPALGELFRWAVPLLASDAEEHDVTVLDPVLASFDTQLAGRAKRLHRPGRDQLIDGGHLSADEVLLEIGVDLARGDRSGCVAFARPRAHLGLARREIGDQPTRLPNGASDAAQTRFVDAVARAHLRLFAVLQLTELRLQAR